MSRPEEIEAGCHIWLKNHIWCFMGLKTYGKIIDEWILLTLWFLNTELLHLTPKRVYIQIQD